MKAKRPYLFRAMYDWMLDCGLTPQIVVDTSVDGVVVPEAYVRDNRIVLNISPSAVRNWEMDDWHLAFDARFSGQPMHVVVPLSAVQAIFARENGDGLVFPAEAPIAPPDRQGEQASSASKTGKNKPTLKVIK
ncbi:MAG: ClpXP protease specificity-enhancing factor [Gammaproteobacteria bacterium]|nr:MAG: ClpXP protease specificity-enhancing factor [Gammaproteobacteria bacterium]